MSNNNKTGLLSSWKSLIFFCIILPIAFRSILFSPFHIPSGSMKPTLLVGDYLFASKFSYGFGKYSFPFGVELFNNRNSAEAPKRGDVIIFRPAPQTNRDFIKRVVGLPGEKIQMIDGHLHINNTPVQRVQIEDYTDIRKDGSPHILKRYIETLPNGVSYQILDDTPSGSHDNTGIYTVPADNYFVMGDNRDNSSDSRVPNVVGFLPKQNIVGKAGVIFASTSSKLYKFWQWASTLRFERFFTYIK